MIRWPSLEGTTLIAAIPTTTIGRPPDEMRVKSITNVARSGVQVPVTTTVPRSSAPNIGGQPGPRLTSTRTVLPAPEGVTTVAQGEDLPPSAAMETAAKYAAGTAAPSVLSSGRTISAGSGFTQPAAAARSASIQRGAPLGRGSSEAATPLLRPGRLPARRRLGDLGGRGLGNLRRRRLIEARSPAAQVHAPAQRDLPGEVGHRRAVVTLPAAVGAEIEEVVPSMQPVLVVVRRRAPEGDEVGRGVALAPAQHQGGEGLRRGVVRLEREARRLPVVDDEAELAREPRAGRGG